MLRLFVSLKKRIVLEISTFAGCNSHSPLHSKYTFFSMIHNSEEIFGMQLTTKKGKMSFGAVCVYARFRSINTAMATAIATAIIMAIAAPIIVIV